MNEHDINNKLQEQYSKGFTDGLGAAKHIASENAKLKEALELYKGFNTADNTKINELISAMEKAERERDELRQLLDAHNRSIPGLSDETIK